MGIDPSGVFNLTEFVVSNAVQTILFSFIGEALAPVFSKVASLFLPNSIVSSLSSGFAPDAYLLGVSASFGSFGVNAVGGAEILASPHTNNLGYYWYGGAILGGDVATKAISSGIGAYFGLVWGVTMSKDYDGPFNSITLSFKKLPITIKKQIWLALVTALASNLSWGKTPPRVNKALRKIGLSANYARKSVNSAIGKAKGIKINKFFDLLEESDMNFFWNDTRSTFGFSLSMLGGSKIYGKGFSMGVSYSRTYYYSIPSGRNVNFR
jgi:hypothetical protein